MKFFRICACRSVQVADVEQHRYIVSSCWFDVNSETASWGQSEDTLRQMFLHRTWVQVMKFLDRCQWLSGNTLMGTADCEPKFGA